ncbi:MAG: ABC transporter permease [Anaerofustis sp.]
MFALIKNECIKLFCKKSTYVVLVLTLLLSCSIPLIYHYSETRAYSNETYQSYLQQEKSYLENAIATDTSSYYQTAYNKASLEVVNLKIESNVTSFNDWRENSSYQLSTLYNEQNLIQYYLTKNKAAITELETSNLTSEIDSASLMDYNTYGSTKKLQARYDALSAQIESYRNAIMNNDPTYVNQLNVNLTNETIAAIQKSIDDLNKSLKYADKTAKDSINEQIANQQKQLQLQNDLLYWLNYRVNNQISLNADDWKNTAISNITSAIQKTYMEPVSKDDYDKSGGNSEYGSDLSYEEYLNKFNQDIAKSKDDIQLYTYALDNNIPPSDMANSTREHVKDIYFIVTLVSIAMIFLISPMVSSEYSKGTIRLLLIRPKKRYKVLLSKFAAAFLIGVLLLALCCGAYIALTVSLYGTADFALPILSVENGAIIATSIMKTVLPVLLKSSAVILFTMTLAFLFSTVVKSTVLAVGVPFALIAFSSIITIILAELKYYDFVSYSIFPYMSLANVINKSGNIGSIMQAFPQLNFDPQYGLILLCASSVVFLIASFWVFGKRDVKN